MSQGPSLLETLTNAVTTSEHRECVQGKEVAYGRRGIPEESVDRIPKPLMKAESDGYSVSAEHYRKGTGRKQPG